MHQTKRQFWAVLVRGPDGEEFAEYGPGEYPVPQRFWTILCDSKKLAERVIELGKFYPDEGEARVVPVSLEVREASEEEAQSMIAREEEESKRWGE